MDLKEHIVGEVEGYPVIYIEEKDTIFCKNTAVKYSLLKRLYDSPFSREKNWGKISYYNKRRTFCYIWLFNYN